MPPEVQEIPPLIHEALLALCRLGSPREVCGYVGQSDGRWCLLPVTNVHADPENFYRMDEYETLEAWNLAHVTIIGEYHSHPHGPARPSSTDLRYAVPGLRHWIVTPESVIEWESS